MHNMKSLEDKWLKYKRKQRRPWYILVIFILLSISLLFFFVSTKDTNVKIFFQSLSDRMGKHFSFFDNSPSCIHGPLIRIEVRKPVLDDLQSDDI